MAGFGGAVEDGHRATGLIVSLVLGLVAGFALDSFNIGLGVFLAGAVVAYIWAKKAGDAFRSAQSQGEKKEDQDV